MAQAAASKGRRVGSEFIQLPGPRTLRVVGTMGTTLVPAGNLSTPTQVNHG